MTVPCVMLVAVEASGDALGAGLMGALRGRLGQGVRFVGVGGPRMTEAGLVSPFDPSELAVLGVFNALGVYPRVLRRVRADLARREQPDVAILIDAWGFNLRVAHAVRRVSPATRLIKYVAPQVWATRPGRARTLARAVDHLLTIHAFDAPLFEAQGLRTSFVGNPALEREFSRTDPVRFRNDIGAAPDEAILLMLPGSRQGEVSRLLPVFEAAACRLTTANPNLKLVVAAARSVAEAVRSRVAAWRCPVVVVEGDGARDDAMRAATVALACSGTVTTELAIAGCPMVVAYRLDPVTAIIARRLIRTPYIALFNVAARRFVAPEFVQEACTGAALAGAVSALLDDPAARARQTAAQSAAIALMRGGVDHPITAAAEAVLEHLDAR